MMLSPRAQEQHTPKAGIPQAYRCSTASAPNCAEALPELGVELGDSFSLSFTFQSLASGSY